MYRIYLHLCGQFLKVFIVIYQIWVKFHSVVWETDLNHLQVTWEEYMNKHVIEKFVTYFVKKAVYFDISCCNFFKNWGKGRILFSNSIMPALIKRQRSVLRDIRCSQWRKPRAVHFIVHSLPTITSVRTVFRWFTTRLCTFWIH